MSFSDNAEKSGRTSSRINVAIAGLGRAGRYMHIPEIMQYPEYFQIVAGCDNAPDRLLDLPEAMKGKKLTTDFEEILADPLVELVCIVTRNPDHVPMALRALEAGKAVVLEKPVAVTEAQAEEILAAAKRYPGKCLWRFNRRFEPQFVQLKKIIASGILGSIRLIKIARHPAFSRRNDWQTLREFNGGMLNNWGPHIIDQALQLLESPVKDFWSDLQHVLAAGDADDQVKIILRGENGRVIDIEFSNCCALPGNLYEVRGSRGSLAVPLSGNEFHLRCIDPAQKLPPPEAIRGNYPLHNAPGEHLQIIEEHIPLDTAGAGHTLRRGKIVTDTPVGNQQCGYASQDTIWEAVYRTLRHGDPYPVRDEEVREILRISLLIHSQCGM